MLGEAWPRGAKRSEVHAGMGRRIFAATQCWYRRAAGPFLHGSGSARARHRARNLLCSLRSPLFAGRRLILHQEVLSSCEINI